MYVLIERDTGWVVGRFMTEVEAIQAAVDWNEDDWALVEFGLEPTDNKEIDYKNRW